MMAASTAGPREARARGRADPATEAIGVFFRRSEGARAKSPFDAASLAHYAAVGGRCQELVRPASRSACVNPAGSGSYALVVKRRDLSARRDHHPAAGV